VPVSLAERGNPTPMVRYLAENRDHWSSARKPLKTGQKRL
jgi:hypothetical protein